MSLDSDTTAFESMPVELSASTTRPTCTSIVQICAAVTLYVSERTVPSKRAMLSRDAWCGSCSSCHAKYMNSGVPARVAAWSWMMRTARSPKSVDSYVPLSAERRKLAALVLASAGHRPSSPGPGQLSAAACVCAQ